MEITAKMAQNMVEILEEIKEECFPKGRNSYPFAEWEQKRERVKQRLRELPKYVGQAVAIIQFMKPKAGQHKKLDVRKRTMLFLFARLMNKSNRDVEEILFLFEPLVGVRVSYKYIERLYSDPEVKTTLHNLFVLLLRDEGVSGDFSGDGTGYSLTITKHYRSETVKQGKDFLHVFRIIDVDTGLYVACGYSNVSEMEAFQKAMTMLTKLGLPIDSMALDRYYSSRKVIELFKEETVLYLIPKKNIARVGLGWSRIIKRILEDPYLFLKGYYLRCLSESGFSADKRRFGGLVRQKREDRREMALFSIAFLHNIFTVRIRPG
jgi:transposase